MSFKPEIVGDVAWLTIDNSTHRNAISAAMWKELPGLLDELVAADGVRFLVLCGAGEHFSSGADISEIDEIILDSLLPAGGLISPAEEALARIPFPTIAAIDGSCYGAGFELAAACDFRLATTRARFAITPARLGIAYPTSGLVRLVQLVGLAAAKQLLLTAGPVDADEAHRLGMVNRVVPVGGLDAELLRVLAVLRENSAVAMQAAKSVLNLIASGSDPRALAERTALWNSRLSAAGDHVIRREAFLNRRDSASSHLQ